jgi:hypothetical protein
MMAWTETENFSTVFGNLRVKGYSLTADSATLEIDTGLDFVNHIEITKSSHASQPHTYAKNVLSAGTASNGFVAITGAASGDDFFMTVYGR